MDDIRTGKPRNCCGCPVALAAARAYGCKVSVGSKTLTPLGDVSDGKQRHLPPLVCEWIKQFDTGHVMNPIVFQPL